MSVPSFLLPAGTRVRRGLHTGRDATHRHLDRVHDHVLRLLGDEEATTRVLVDVAARAAARARDLDEAATFGSLVRLAHARMASAGAARPDDALVARLAGDRDPGARALVRAVAGIDRHGAALLDLTARHAVDLREAAVWIGLERSTAERRHAEALALVRSGLTGAGAGASPDLDVVGTLARLPVVGAPERIHQRAGMTTVTDRRGPLPSSLAWLGTAATVLGTVAALILGLPAVVSADLGDKTPVVVAESVTEGPAARQLATPGEDVLPDTAP